jgi:AraC-like DNA-binding protein
MGLDYNDEITRLKRKLISHYVYSTLATLGLYSLVLYFLLHNTLFAAYTFSYFCLLGYTWILLRKNYKIKNIVHLLLISGSVFVFFMLLCLWESSVVSCMFLVPLPLGAYIFLEKKYLYLYTFFILLIIVAAMLLSESVPPHYRLTYANRTQLTISDVFVFLENMYIISVLLFYNDKIRKLEVIKEYHTYKPDLSDGTEETPDIVAISKKDEKFVLLFENIRSVIEEQHHFKNAEFTISQLSTIMKINNVYLSKAIKISGYKNFSHYINKCRVNYVKELLQESDIQKVTLMYIYTEAGFSNQSTFNRVFKQIENITPSEYVDNLFRQNGNIQFTL